MKNCIACKGTSRLTQIFVPIVTTHSETIEEVKVYKYDDIRIWDTSICHDCLQKLEIKFIKYQSADTLFVLLARTVAGLGVVIAGYFETVAEVGFSGDVFCRVNFTMEPTRFLVN